MEVSNRRMHKDKILQRLDLVNTTNNSVVATAAWCSLHAHDSTRILECIAEKMQSPHTTYSQRTALVYVLHELLLSCSRNGVALESKQAVLLAARSMLPTTLRVIFHPTFVSRQAAAQGEGGKGVKKESFEEPVAEAQQLSCWGLHNFTLAMEKSIEWWRMLQLFPEPWLEEVREILRQVRRPSSSEDNFDGSTHNGMTTSSLSTPPFLFASNVQRLAHWVQKYEELKERWTVLQHKDKSSSSLAHSVGIEGRKRDAISAAGSAVLRCLNILEKMREKDFPHFYEFQEWCYQERARLSDHGHPSLSSSSVSGGSSRHSPHYAPLPVGMEPEKLSRQQQGTPYAHSDRFLAPSSTVKIESSRTSTSLRSREDDHQPHYSDDGVSKRVKLEGEMMSSGLPSRSYASGMERMANAGDPKGYADQMPFEPQREAMNNISASNSDGSIVSDGSSAPPPVRSNSSDEKKEEDEDDILGSFF